MRIADIVADEVAKHTDHIFLVTGGGAMHLNDAFRNSKIKTIACHNEQTCSIAAESYFKISNKIGAVNVTTGPGGINALNGVFGAWTDSIPMIIISGQVKRETLLETYGLNGKLRQLGDQEVDIISMVRGITKYAKCVTDPTETLYHIKKAINIAKSGRPGPCWIDIPGDIQALNVDLNDLIEYNHQEITNDTANQQLENEIKKLLLKLKSSKRPVIYAGSGIRLSNSYKDFLSLLTQFNVPVVTAWNSNDLIWDEHPLNAGRPGSVGDRAGNFAVQNADLLIILGTRLNIRQISYNWKNFSPNSYKIMVDIDAAEIEKPTLKIDLGINADLKVFFDKILNICRSENFELPDFSNWINQTQSWRNRYPVLLKEYFNKKEPVNPYIFVDRLFDLLDEEEIIVTSDGTACVTTFQGAKIKKGQRIYHNSGCASMGYELPAAIGAYYASLKRIICIAGDGSIMMNLQELQTISGNNLNVKIFLLNNDGYHSIRQTQSNYFGGNMIGCGPESGLTFPNFGKVAKAFGYQYLSVKNNNDLEAVISATLNSDKPIICEIFIDKSQEFSPKLQSKQTQDGSFITPELDDMAPFLERDEYLKNKYYK